MAQPNDLSRSLIPLCQENALIVVIDTGLSSWLVAGILPRVERHPLKKLNPDEDALLLVLYRWRDEAVNAGAAINRITVAFEAGRDGFWLARWLRFRGIETYVIHSTSVAVPRQHRRPKTDRLDTELLKRKRMRGCAAAWSNWRGDFACSKKIVTWCNGIGQEPRMHPARARP